jgi:enamidase
MATAAPEAKSGKVVIKNIGLMLSGDIDRPILDADTIVVVDGIITAVGKATRTATPPTPNAVVDVRQTCVCPGLIDSHVHPVFGDWTPRQNQIGWIESTMNGGVTTMISAGEVHLPGRPKDIVGPQGPGHHRAARVRQLPPRRCEGDGGRTHHRKRHDRADFKELAESGVGLLGEVGLGSVKAGYEAQADGGLGPQAWHPEHHPHRRPEHSGSGLIDKDVVLEADADVIGHINGGHTSLPWRMCASCARSPAARHRDRAQRQREDRHPAARKPWQLKCPHRVILGTDGPAGSGVQPLGMLRMIALLSSAGNIPAELVFCFATGNTARIRKLNCGLIEVGRAADFVFMDRAQHTAGATCWRACNWATSLV